MNTLIIVTLANLLCATVTTIEDVGAENVLQIAESYDYHQIDFFVTPLEVNSSIFDSQPVIVDGYSFTCALR